MKRSVLILLFVAIATATFANGFKLYVSHYAIYNPQTKTFKSGVQAVSGTIDFDFLNQRISMSVDRYMTFDITNVEQVNSAVFKVTSINESGGTVIFVLKMTASGDVDTVSMMNVGYTDTSIIFTIKKTIVR